MTKLSDWQARLNAYLARVWFRPFAYGAHDCALFAAGAVEAMTGVDPAAAYRGRYATQADGMALLLVEGGAMSPIAHARMLFDQVEPAFAQTGDLAAVETPEGRALGVVRGAVVYLAGRDGLVTLPVTRARHAFRVPG
jgi:hypothetical protein